MEIDPFYLPDFKKSCMGFVIELQHPHIPDRIGVHTPSVRGVILRQSILAIRPREQQVDANGVWIHFFGHPPPPPPPHGHTPHNAHLSPAPAQLAPPHAPAAPAPFGPAPPAQPPTPHAYMQAASPLHPTTFLSAAILCHGFIHTFPLPRLPPLPIIIHLTNSAVPVNSTCRAYPVLLLTWYAYTDEPT
ncbi:hypothetical protein SETIT_5G126700v2 [Setaria italica]|uniref:Uncharacterized protein n=1 Tax=Setaria italica TaxID=4555 RepID=A0A368R473_SETIT|nr:hypothetical protein SETIT_5G126700v2 [Setaria italica]